MSTIMITGATGFIGSNLCGALKEHRIIALGKKNENPVDCEDFYACDLSGFPLGGMPDIDVLFHLAAFNDTQNKNDEEMMRVNFHEPVKLFTRLLEKRCRRFIYASSCAVYGNQKTPFEEDYTKKDCLTSYAKSKLMFEEFAKKFSEENEVRCVGLRYSNVYGSNEQHKGKRASMIYQLADKFKKKEQPVLFKYGQQERDWVHVDDVTRANALAMQCEKSEIFNVGSGESTSFNRIVEVLNEACDLKLKPKYVECEFHETYQQKTSISIEKIRKTLGYEPEISAEEGIIKVLRS